MSIVLVVTCILVYNWSYHYIWFKLGLLFDDIASQSDNTDIPLNRRIADGELDITDNFVQKFYAEYSLSSKRLMKFIRVLFSSAMVCYIITIEIVLWQIKSVDKTQSGDFITEWVWWFVSMALSVILILIQPFFIIISLMNKFFNDRFDLDRLVIFTSIALMAFIAVLRLISIGPFQYSNNILTRLSISGVTIMAVLSGIASVSTIYYTALYFWNQYGGIKASQSSSRFASNSIRSKKLLIWARKSWIKQQLINYQSLRDKQISELNTLKMQQQEPTVADEHRKNVLYESIAQTQLQTNMLQGIIDEAPNVRLARKMFEIGFLVYCCYRVFLTFVVRLPKILTHLIEYPLDYEFDHFTASSDPLAVTIANVLDFCLFNFNYQHDLDSLTSQISLFLSASLFICAFSTVNTTVSFFISLLPSRFQVLALFALQNSEGQDPLPLHANDKRQHQTPSMIKNLLLSELAGVYVVATVLMIRSNLPFEVAERLKDMLGQKFTVTSFAIDCWFDEMYAISCLMTIFFIKLVERTVYLVNKNDRLKS